MDPGTLTRRDVLERLGLIGGSSLMIGAMDAWDLMGEPSRPRPVLTGTPPDTRSREPVTPRGAWSSPSTRG